MTVLIFVLEVEESTRLSKASSWVVSASTSSSWVVSCLMASWEGWVGSPTPSSDEDATETFFLALPFAGAFASSFFSASSSEESALAAAAALDTFFFLAGFAGGVFFFAGLFFFLGAAFFFT